MFTEIGASAHQVAHWLCSDNKKSAESFREDITGRVLNNVDFFAGISALVVGILAYLGMIPCSELLTGLLIGGGSVNILASFLRTYQQDKKALLGVGLAKCWGDKGVDEAEVNILS